MSEPVVMPQLSALHVSTARHPMLEVVLKLMLLQNYWHEQPLAMTVVQDSVQICTHIPFRN